MTTPSDTMRTEFEAWAKLRGWSVRPGISGIGYAAERTNAAWLAFQFAWQVSAEAERERCAKIADGFTCGGCGMDGKVSAAIRALNRTAAQQET